ncbi:MAG: leucyl aminopeptidase family protein [Rhodospirillales bacterium]|nr:leucyl aminopeptidase family protein [Rhodospirillales bacterium]
MSSCFLTKTSQTPVTIHPLDTSRFKSWQKKQGKALQAQIGNEGFSAKPGQILIHSGKDGGLSHVLIGVSDPLGLYDLAAGFTALEKSLAADFLKKAAFALDETGLTAEALNRACMGWGLAGYRFDTYKKNEAPRPRLLWPKGADKKRVQAFIEAISLIRTLINTPANDLGPEELEKAARDLAAPFDAKIKVTKGAALEKGFPLVHAVGKASPRAPRLIELRWGKPKDPKITLVGKGVCFDTGGLNLKPGTYMALMKKDMGGAAHVLALAQLIMGLKLPVCLRVLVPAVDNDVSGGAFRPGDVLQSRKGLTVENTNTDAEGRLILADALAYGCEDKPELLIDFATLTGSARAALGPDVPPFFSNSDKVATSLQKCADSNEDPLWRMPLWQPYHDKNKSPIADLVNSAKSPGDLIYSGLFLQSFVEAGQDWVHLDVYAWQDSGTPGKPMGGTDMGLRAVFALLEERYRT